MPLLRFVYWSELVSRYAHTRVRDTTPLLPGRVNLTQFRNRPHGLFFLTTSCQPLPPALSALTSPITLNVCSQSTSPAPLCQTARYPWYRRRHVQNRVPTAHKASWTALQAMDRINCLSSPPSLALSRHKSRVCSPHLTRRRLAHHPFHVPHPSESSSRIHPPSPSRG